MKLDRLVELEKRLARLLDRRLRDPKSPHDALEVIGLILDHVEEHALPTPGGGRTFPYDRVTIHVATPPDRALAWRVVLDHPPGLEHRVRARLEEAGCALAQPVEVETHVLEEAPPEGWGELPFRIEYRERKRRRERPKPRPAAVPRVRLLVQSGAAGAKRQVFQLERINVGRLRRVDGRPGAVRHNHLAFADDGGEVNSTVSRAHAHLQLDPESGALLLFDDGSVHGTRILRGGRTVAVPRQGSRGVRLRHGDDLEFGSARVRFEIEPEAS